MKITLIEFDNLQEQLDKLVEERHEVNAAFEEGDKIKLVSEYWDEIQVLFSLIWEEVGNVRNFINSYKRHCKKLDKYNKTGRIKIKRKITLRSE
jgi:phosphoribosyl-ATP pyrophosphohydrolase